MKRRGPAVRVKAKANFRMQSGAEVNEGEVIEVGGAELQFLLDTGKVTKDLDWTPENPGAE